MGVEIYLKICLTLVSSEFAIATEKVYDLEISNLVSKGS